MPRTRIRRMRVPDESFREGGANPSSLFLLHSVLAIELTIAEFIRRPNLIHPRTLRPSPETFRAQPSLVFHPELPMTRAPYMMLACAILGIILAFGHADAFSFDMAAAGISAPKGTTMAAVPTAIRG